MRTHSIPSCKRKSIIYIFIIPPDLALRLILISSNYLCLEHIFMVPKVFEALRFYCITISHLFFSYIRNYLSLFPSGILPLLYRFKYTYNDI